MKRRSGVTAMHSAPLVATLLLAMLSGCTSRKVEVIRITSESSPSLDVSGYRTYRWRSAAPERTGGDARDSAALSDWRLRNAVERQLAAKGYEKRPTGTVDFFVDYDIAVTDKSTESIQDYMSYRDRGGTLGPQEAFVFGYPAGSLTLEIVDGGTGQLVWRGSGEAVANLRDNGALMEEAVRKMLQRFPTRSD